MSVPTAPEAPLWLEVNGRHRLCWSATPAAVETLVTGFLLTGGYIERSEQLLAIEVVAEPEGCIGARVVVPAGGLTRVESELRHLRSSGCGVLHYVHCEPQALRRRRPAPPGAAELGPAFRELFATADAAYPEGGMHAAAVWAEGRMRAPAFDVSRHNAIDRALGEALPHTDLARAGVLLSSRVSGTIALKAARAGVAFVASRSIPTTLAARLAESAELPIVARAGRRDARESR